MKHHLTAPILIPALALLLLAAAFVGYQAVSAQISPGSPGGDPPSAPTGLTAEPVDGLVHLSWDALGDDSVTDIHIALPHQSHNNDPFSRSTEEG